jgi:hypothetical protein
MFDSAWLSEVPPPPDGSDVSGAVAALLRRGFDQLETQGEPELYPGYAWTILAGQETEQLVAIEGRYPFLDRITFGFFEPEVEDRTGLGVVVYVDPPSELLERGELHDAYPPAEDLTMAGRRFPVAIRIAPQELETSLTKPSKAQTAVWTTVHKNTNPTSGWLIPYHAVKSTNAVVSYSDGCNGRVIESFGRCWDAVLASSTLSAPPNRPVVARDVLPPGLALQVTDQYGQHSTPTLVQVDVNIGLIGYGKSPIRMTYDWTSSAKGDSGALVSDNGVTAAPVAMHQGSSVMRDRKGNALKAPDGSDLRRAFGLCLFQIQSTKDGEFLI